MYIYIYACAFVYISYDYRRSTNVPYYEYKCSVLFLFGERSQDGAMASMKKTTPAFFFSYHRDCRYV